MIIYTLHDPFISDQSFSSDIARQVRVSSEFYIAASE